MRGKLEVLITNNHLVFIKQSINMSLLNILSNDISDSSTERYNELGEKDELH